MDWLLLLASCLVGLGIIVLFVDDDRPRAHRGRVEDGAGDHSRGR